MDIRQLLFLNAACGSSPQLVEETAVGNPALFETDIRRPLNELSIPIECHQLGSGEPSPSNVRQIVGCSGINVSHLSKNDIIFSATEVTANGLSWTVSDTGSVAYIGTPSAYSGVSVGIYNVKGGETIHSYLVGDIDNVKFDDAWIYDENWNHIATASSGWTGKRTPQDQGVIDLSEYPDAAYVTIGLSRELDNVPMDGICYAVVGTDLSSPETYDITFPMLENLIDDTKYQSDSTHIGIGCQYDFTIPLQAGTYTFSVDFLNGTHYGAYLKEKNASSAIEIWYTNETEISERSFVVPSDGLYRLWLYDRTSASAENVGECRFYETEQKVYGGTLDVTTGVLSLTHAYRKFTGASSESWAVNAGHTGFACIQWGEVKNKGVTACNMSPANHNSGDFPSFGYVYNQNSGYNIRTCLVDEAVTAEQFKAWLAEHPLELVCPLIEPVTVQLTATQINALIGANIICVNSPESVTIKYLKKSTS